MQVGPPKEMIENLITKIAEIIGIADRNATTGNGPFLLRWDPITEEGQELILMSFLTANGRVVEKAVTFIISDI